MNISIITPILNEEENILCFLDGLSSLFCSPKTHLEIILVDGGSTDNTLPIAQQWHTQNKNILPNIVIHSSTTKGRGVQMNDGARLATGEIFLFLHVDTFLPSSGLSLVEEKIKEDPSIIGGAFALRFSGTSKWLRGIEKHSNWRAKIFRIYHGDQAIFVTKDIFWKIGGYKNVPILEDVLFSKALTSLGKTIFLSCPVRTSSRRIEENGIFRSIFFYILVKTLYRIGLSPHRIARFYQHMRRG